MTASVKVSASASASERGNMGERDGAPGTGALGASAHLCVLKLHTLPGLKAIKFGASV